MNPKIDAQINQDVFDELTWDPAVPIADLNIETLNGRVLLTGTVETFWVKQEASRAAYRVRGVRSVENLLKVDPSATGIHHDYDIADEIQRILLIDYQIPEHRISIKVDHGQVTLVGSVDWAYERQAAVDAVLKIAGVLSVDNQVTLTPPHASAAEIQRGIARAFARNANLPDDQIVVEAEGGHVTLRGNVEFWSERNLADAIAWKSAGVTLVTNNIEVLVP